MAKILFLEDDPFLGKGLFLQLQGIGHEVAWKQTIAHAKESLTEGEFDLLIFDVNLPDGSGLDFCRELRGQNVETPIIMLTAKTDEDSVEAGFDFGANDYVKKPFSNRELLARIRSLLNEPLLREKKLRVGPIVIMLDQRKITIEGQTLELNRREFDIFVRLAKSPGAVLSRDQLLLAIDGGEEVLDRTIDSQFSHIRTKLRKLGVQSVIIRSVYGVGYALEVA